MKSYESFTHASLSSRDCTHRRKGRTWKRPTLFQGSRYILFIGAHKNMHGTQSFYFAFLSVSFSGSFVIATRLLRRPRRAAIFPLFFHPIGRVRAPLPRSHAFATSLHARPCIRSTSVKHVRRVARCWRVGVVQGACKQVAL